METSESQLPGQQNITTVARRFDRGVRIVAAAYLLFLCWQIAATFHGNLVLPWFNSSDEIVVAGEVIRFSNLDFHQHFYDMPGTPLMLLGAAEWRMVYAWGVFRGFRGDSNLFSFQHLQQLMTLLRADNVVFFLLSAILLFRIVSKIFDPFAGAAAATLLLMNVSYTVTAASLRVEPLAMCFLLGAILVLTESHSKSTPFWAGVLGGLAAAERLHSVTATLPVLILLLISQTWGREADYPARTRRGLAFLAGGLVLASALLYYFFGLAASPIRTAYPLAFSLFAKASLLPCLLAVVALALYFIPQTRRAVVNTMTPKFFGLMGGVAAGFVIGIPNIFTEYERLLKSMNFYSGTYKDAEAIHLSLAGKITSYLTFFLKIISPDFVTAILLISGVVLLVALPRYRPLWPYLAAAASFFVSTPLDLVRSPHHVALWIPFFAIVSVVPIAAIFEASKSRWQHWYYPSVAAAVLLLLALDADLKHIPDGFGSLAKGHAERLHNIELSRAWIRGNTEKDSSFMLAFYCFGPETFYSWFREMGLRVPDTQIDTREYITWWGQQSALMGRSGFACVSRSDLATMKRWELIKAGEGLNPLSDARFRLLHSFGQGANEMFLLHFDMRQADSPRPAGLTFSMPSALRLESISAYDKSSIQRTSPMLITTSPAAWSFSALIPIIVDPAMGGKAVAHIRGRVLSGAVGIGILDQRGNTIQNEQYVFPSASFTDIYFPCGPNGRPDGLIIRNIFTKGRSQIAVEATELLARARQISPVVRLEEMQAAYDKASIVSKPAWMVVTAPSQWSYAATMPLHVPAQTPGIVLKIRAQVLDGQVSFSQLALKDNTLHFEQSFPKSREPMDVFVPVSPAEGLSRVLIRDTAPNGTRSRVVLEGVETWQLQ